MLKSLAETTRVTQALTPAADAAGRTGAYVTLKHCRGAAYIVCNIAQGNAATIALTINQATAVAGTSAKAITGLCRIWTNLDTSANDTLTPQSAAVSYTTDAGVKNKVVIFEVLPETLDLANGFTSIAIVTGASNVANITSAMYHLTDYGYQGLTLPTAVVD